MSEPTKYPEITEQAQHLADAETVLRQLLQHGPATARELAALVDDDDVRLGWALTDLLEHGKIEADPPLHSFHRGSRGARIYRVTRTEMRTDR